MLVGQCKFTSDIFKHHMEISSYLQLFFIAYSFRVCNAKVAKRRNTLFTMCGNC